MAGTARVTVTLAADLVDDLVRLERNRSRFIAEAVRHELTRRRQAALIQSIHSPHADTVALVDAGLADWVSDLPADDGVVDVAAGTPVRWVEGQGWTKGRARHRRARGARSHAWPRAAGPSTVRRGE